MKKKVLFALIALFSFVSTWAADVVKVGNYDVTLSQKVVGLVGGTATAPTISSVKKGTATVIASTPVLCDVNGAPITGISAVGNYFLKITADSKTLYVPFQVGHKVGTEIVFNQATYDASLANGFEKAYHEDNINYPAGEAEKFDVWNPATWSEPNPKAKPTTENGYVYSIEPLVNPAHDLFDSPFIGFVVPAGIEGTYDLAIQANGKTGFMRGGEFSAAVGHNYTFWSFANVTGDNFMFAQFYDNDNLAKYRFAKTVGTSQENPTKILKYGSTTEAATFVEEALEATQTMQEGDLAKSIGFYLVNQENPFALNLTLDSYQTTYNGSNTAEPILTVTYDGEAIDLKDDSQTSGNTPSQNDNDGYTVTVTKDGAAVTSYAAAGTYLIKVEYKGAVAFAEYQVNKFALSVGLGNLTKEYGEADPTEPVYAIVYSNVPTGDDIVIKGQNIQRTSNETPNFAAELPGTQIQYTVYGDAYVEGNDSYIVSVTSTSGWMQVEKKVVNDNEFMVEVDDAALIYDAYKKEPAVHVYRRFVTGEDTEGNPTYGEWDKTNDLATQFEVTYANNINADAYGVPDLVGVAPNQKEVYNYFKEPADRATATVTPKATGPFMEIADDATTTEVDESSKISAQEFKIRQRQIVAGDVSAVADQTFNNQDQTPAVTVSFQNTNLTPTTVTLAEGTDYTIVFTDNKWVTDAAKYTVEAVHTTSGTAPLITKTYTGNYWGSVDKTFKITKFKFAIQAEDKSKAFGEDDPDLTVKTVDPTTGEAKALPTDVQLSGILKQNADESYYHVTRVPGEHVGAYVISVTDAELKGNAATAEDPAHNYELTGLIPGAFTIVKADNLYYVSSKKVEKEYDGTADVNGPDNKYFNGYYLYKRVRPGNSRESFEEILPTDDAYSLIAGPTQNVLNDTRTGAGINVYWSNGAGSTIYSWNILPDVTGLSTDEYTLATINLHAGSGEHDGEGYLQVNPKTVFLVANDQTSVYGEPLVVPTTADTKVYGYKLEGTQKVIDKDQVLTVTLNFNAPTVEGVTSTSEIKKHEGAIQFDGNYGYNPRTRQSIAAANPNYDVRTVAGDYTITGPTEAITIAVTWTKTVGQKDSEATAAYRVTHPNKVGYQLSDADRSKISFDRGNGAVEEVGTYELAANQIKVTPTDAKFDGEYSAVITGELVIVPIGDVTITLNNQTINYDGADIVTTLVTPYASVTGLNADQIEALGLSIAYTKPEIGFVKNGAELKVKCGDTAVGEPGEGHVVTAAEWPWVKDFGKVTVKSGKLYVNAADEITLDIVAFNNAKYNADADKTDQLIKDYSGTEVNSVKIICSQQDTEAPKANQYTVKGDQWYSMVLPFEATARQISEIFNGYAVVDVLNQKNEATKASEIRFSLWVKPVPANEPFVAKTDVDFVFDPVTIYATEEGEGILIQYPVDKDGKPAAASVADGKGNEFIGTYKKFTAPNGSMYDLINLSKGDISPATKDAYVRPLGAYIKVAAGVPNNQAPVRIVFEEADGTLTAIDAVEVEDAENAAEFADGWYTVTGVKLTAEPTVSGTYIYNGKKVFFQAK